MKTTDAIKNITLVAVLTGSIFANASESNTYVGLQANIFQLNIADRDAINNMTTDRDAQPAALTLKLGGEVYDWLAVEAQYTYGVASDEIEETGINLNVESMVALSAVFKYHVTGPLRVFAKAGVARTSFATREDEKVISKGLIYGAGFSLDVSESSRLLIEVSEIKDANFERSGNKMNADTIGFGIQFDI